MAKVRPLIFQAVRATNLFEMLELLKYWTEDFLEIYDELDLQILEFFLLVAAFLGDTPMVAQPFQ